MFETVNYTYRLRPGAQAQGALLTEWHRCRFLWNEAVHQNRIGNKPTLCKLSKLLTEARGRSTWLRSGSQVAQQQTLRTYAQSLDHSFKIKGRGRPKFKARKKSLPTLEYTLRGFTVREGRLRLPAGVSIPVVWSRDLPSEPTSVRVHQDSLGYWYASFVVRRQVEAAPQVADSIGIDWGVTTTATTTDPAYDLPYLGHRKLHQKAAHQNKHAARVWAGRVVADHQTIAVEDLKPRFLAKSTMARKSADAAIGAAKAELIERGTRAGRTVVLVPPAYTTMTCSRCAARNKTRLGLGVRTFRCESCGFTAGRDLNAARVILATAERIRAGADDVRHLLPPLGLVASAVRARNLRL